MQERHVLFYLIYKSHIFETELSCLSGANSAHINVVIILDPRKVPRSILLSISELETFPTRRSFNKTVCDDSNAESSAISCKTLTEH